MCLFQVPLIHVMVTPLLMPDCPTRMSISATMCLSSSALSSPRPGKISDGVIITKPRNCYVKVTTISVHTLTVQSDINPRATVASIKVLLQVIKASIHSRFALSHAHALGILHYQEPHFSFIQGILPASQLNATVRATFVPDSTLEFITIFSSLKCTKSSIFSDFLHS